MHCLVHFLGSLEVGGKERVALQLARRGRKLGLDHRLLLFDEAPRGTPLDLDPEDVPWSFVKRGSGLDLGFIRRVARELRRLGAEGIHAHNDSAIFYAPLAARLAGLGRRRPAVIGTFHTRPGHDTALGRRATRLATHLADAVTSVSDELGTLLCELGWTRPTEVIWNGIDPAEFSATGDDGGWRERLGVARGAFLVGHVGRHDRVKRQLDLVEAARTLVNEGLALEVVFAGEGPERAAFERVTCALPWVHVVDRVVDVAAFLRALDVFVLCSSHEAAPRALMEAMSCGRPCIATSVGGIPKIVTDSTGIPSASLVPPGEPKELAARLGRLLSDAAQRRRLGAAARERMSSFSGECEWNAYAALFERARKN